MFRPLLGLFQPTGCLRMPHCVHTLQVQGIGHRDAGFSSVLNTPFEQIPVQNLKYDYSCFLPHPPQISVILSIST